MRCCSRGPLLLLLLLGACRGGDAGSAGAPDVPEARRRGGTATVGANADVGDISPLTWTVQTAQYLQMFVLFTPLIRFNRRFEPEPYGAQSWEVNRDTTELTFYLRRDLRWHDGVPTTARDWKFSYDLARDPRTAFINSSFWTDYGEAEAPDSFTFRVHMRPHAEFLDPWRSFAPVPEHLLRGVPPEELRRHPFGTRTPMGNGPFRFVERLPGQSWTFAANPDFPPGLGGRPYLDRLVYRVIPEPTTLLTELLTGGVDFYMGVPAEQAPQVQASGEARLVDFLDRWVEHIVWNERRPPFGDPRVRRALTLALDRQGIVDAVRRGYGQVANSTVPPMFWQYDASAGAELRYDPARARALLAEAGWTDRDGDGVREDAAGRPFRFTLSIPQGNAERRDIGEIVQAQLRAVGVVAEPRVTEFNTLVAQASDPKRRDFDAIVVGWIPEFRLDDSDLFACSKRDNPLTWAGYCNPATDRLLDTLQRIPSRDAARPFWREYQERIARDQPFALLFYPRRLEGVSERLRNVHPDARGELVGVDRWWIVPGMRRAAGR